MSQMLESNGRKYSWRTRLALRRNRILGSQRFQNWAAKTPIFRSVARRKAAGQFDLIAGFVYTQITFALVTSGAVAQLRKTPMTTVGICNFMGIEIQNASRLLKAARALDLVEEPENDLWILGEVGAALSANEGAMAMIDHHALLYDDLKDPLTVFSGEARESTQLSRFWSYADGSRPDQEAAAYSDLMRATQPMVWQQILGKYPFHRHNRMLDVGGGSGAFIEQVEKVAPELGLGVFDLPEVVELATRRNSGVTSDSGIEFHRGSFRDDAIPSGYDLVTLVRILHDHDDDVAMLLLSKVFESLPNGGNLLVLEPMAETRGAERMGDAYFGLYLWAMGSGSPRSSRAITEMLKNTGFSGIKEIKTHLPIIARALVATK